MHGDLARVAAQQGGYFFRRQALDCGYSDHEIRALLRHREWRRLRRGAYALGALVDGLDPAARHRLLVRATVGNLDAPVVVANHSALAFHHVDLWGVDLAEVHVHREPGRTSRRDAGVVHHLGLLPYGEVEEIDGLLVAALERAAIDTARTVAFDTGVVLLDGSRRQDFDLARAEDILERQRDWTGSVGASRALGFSDGRAQTVGESRTRLLMARLGLPRPDLQRSILDADGSLIAVTDLFVDEWATAVEFDGKLKYGRELYERASVDVDLGEVVWREKRREDRIRDRGIEVVRIVWSELDSHDAAVAGRFLRARDRALRHRPTG